MLTGGGGATSFEVALTQEPEVLAILKGGSTSFHPLKVGHERFYPVSRAGAKGFGPSIFPFCRPPLPEIDDRFLTLCETHGVK